MQRRPTTQDITWILDLHRNKQLDLDPPYQRRSVWTSKDKQFFLDTIFRNFPSPALFLHKTINEAGTATYHVVDGKQRTETILAFINDKLRVSKDFGDNRLDGKKWSDLQGEPDLKKIFWNYQVTVELIDFEDGTIVNEVFERLNRNSRKLTAQELRHAKFDGWLIKFVEAESADEDWKTLGVSTTARARRMADAQFISELACLVLEGSILGFDQDEISQLYAKYDDPIEGDFTINTDDFINSFYKIKHYLIAVEKTNKSVTQYANNFAHFYSLWGIVAKHSNIYDPDDFAHRYKEFMHRVEEISNQNDIQSFLNTHDLSEYQLAFKYLTNSRGASTDLKPREERHKVLEEALFNLKSGNAG